MEDSQNAQTGASAIEVNALVSRVLSLLPGDKITVKRMFGGHTLMLNGNMLCCVSPKGLMVRVGAAAEPEALRMPFAGPCTGTGRPMKGFIMVEYRGIAGEAELSGWVNMAKHHVEALPAKLVKPARVRRIKP